MCELYAPLLPWSAMILQDYNTNHVSATNARNFRGRCSLLTDEDTEAPEKSLSNNTSMPWVEYFLVFPGSNFYNYVQIWSYDTRSDSRLLAPPRTPTFPSLSVSVSGCNVRWELLRDMPHNYAEGD